jgi:two-component system sensor histidine kinase KdpD
VAEPSNPESFLRLIHRSRRGRLKVYLGYGPGVGKTYQMLLEGQRLKAQGVDVVAAFVETHDRADTASLVLGLEVLPRREVVYRGVRLEEMDLPALLARKPHPPEVALIDELAHTNVPGSANTKRYQDVQEVLAAGIHVITTLNVQHLESLYDTVERLIGVKVKERLPDWVLADADEIVTVDLAAEDLQRRMQEGKIYGPERAGQALANFFRKGNLEQLRELALREAASVIERRGRGGREEESVQAPDQVVVCLSSRSPDATALLRYTSRLAGRLNRNWYALYVQTAAEDPARLDPGTRKGLSDTLALANQLGAMVFTFRGEDVVDTILRFAREYRIGHVVVGRAAPRTLWERWKRWTRGLGRRPAGIDLGRLIARAEGLNMVVVDTRRVPAGPAVPVPFRPRGQRGQQISRAALDPVASAPAGMGRPAAPPARRAGPPPPLSALLAPGAVVFVTHPMSKHDLLELLVQTLASQPPGFDAADVLRLLMRRESEASTFLSEGIALPHVRVAGLKTPRVALANLRPDLPEKHELAGVELVFMLLCSEQDPDGCLGLLAAAARLFRDNQARAELRRAGGGAEAIEIIRQHESAARAAGPARRPDGPAVKGAGD